MVETSQPDDCYFNVLDTVTLVLDINDLDTNNVFHAFII